VKVEIEDVEAVEAVEVEAVENLRQSFELKLQIC